MSERNAVVELEPTWVSIADAAGYAGVSRAKIERALASGNLVVRLMGRRRQVQLEAVLATTVPTELDRLRARIERAASWEGAPPAVRQWGESMIEVVIPLLDRLREAEARAALAEARLDVLRSAARASTG